MIGRNCLFDGNDDRKCSLRSHKVRLEKTNLALAHLHMVQAMEQGRCWSEAARCARLLLSQLTAYQLRQRMRNAGKQDLRDGRHGRPALQFGGNLVQAKNQVLTRKRRWSSNVGKGHTHLPEPFLYSLILCIEGRFNCPAPLHKLPRQTANIWRRSRANDSFCRLLRWHRKQGR